MVLIESAAKYFHENSACYDFNSAIIQHIKFSKKISKKHLTRIRFGGRFPRKKQAVLSAGKRSSMKLEFSLEGKIIVIESQGPVTVTVREASAPATVKSEPEPEVSSNESTMFQRLVELRRQLAAEQGVPPYVIFQDKSLRHMAAVLPGNPEEFAKIVGVGQAKLEKYGSQFMAVINGAE